MRDEFLQAKYKVRSADENHLGCELTMLMLGEIGFSLTDMHLSYSRHVQF